MKLSTVWKLVTFLALVALMGNARAESNPVYTGPGFNGVKVNATGFFRTQRIGKIWWIIDPLGRGFYSVGVGHVRESGEGCERLGYPPYMATAQTKYGSSEAWAEATLKRYREWGFNTLGELGDVNTLGHRRPAHTAFYPFGYVFAQQDGLPTMKTGFAVFPNVFSPEWPKFCDKQAREICAPARTDPWLLGIFLDNELAWGGPLGNKWGLFDEAWKKPAADPAKRAWIEFLKTRLKSPEDFAANWGSPRMTWEELAQNQTPYPPITPLAYKINSDWLKLVAERYFRNVTNAVRRYDPNHMILGVRFTSDVPDILDVAGKYCDVITINFYPHVEPGSKTPQREIDLLADWHKRAGKPLFISEWSFPAFDSGLPCTVGAGMRLETQQQRAKCWAEFQETLFRLPFVVGSNYFMWTDEPAFGIASYHTENTDYGLVDENDEPYADLIEKAKSINPHVYSLHSRGGIPQGAAPREKSSSMREFPVTQAVTDPRIEFSDMPLRISGPSAEGAWTLSLGNERLGEIQPLIIQHHRGYKASVPSESRITQVRSNDTLTAVDVELSNRSTASEKGEVEYRSVWRVLVPRKMHDWVGMQCLMVENTGAEAFRLYEVWCRLYSDIAKNGVADTPFGLSNMWVPFYRNGSFFWDATAKAGVGASFLNADDFDYFFTQGKDRGTGDLKRRVDITLMPGGRFENESPIAFFFPMEHDSPSHFARRVERLMKSVSR